MSRKRDIPGLSSFPRPKLRRISSLLPDVGGGSARPVASDAKGSINCSWFTPPELWVVVVVSPNTSACDCCCCCCWLLLLLKSAKGDSVCLAPGDGVPISMREENPPPPFSSPLGWIGAGCCFDISLRVGFVEEDELNPFVEGSSVVGPD